jgi:putative transposase
MEQKKYSEIQILKILKEYNSGVSARELSRQYGVNRHTIYDWKRKYGGIESSSELEKYKALAQENTRLKKMYIEASMERDMLKDVLSKKL